MQREVTPFRGLTLEQAIAYQKARVMQSLADRVAAGYTVTFPDGQTGTIQLRLQGKEGLPSDIDLVTGIGAGSLAKVVLGVTGTEPFRDAQNQEHHMTPQQMVQVSLEALGYVSACYKASWAIKDSIGAATTVEAVAAVDITAGWPPDSA